LIKKYSGVKDKTGKKIYLDDWVVNEGGIGLSKH